MSDTIAAVATGAGVSAIGIVRVSGPLSVSLMDALFRPAEYTLTCLRTQRVPVRRVVL